MRAPPQRIFYASLIALAALLWAGEAAAQSSPCLSASQDKLATSLRVAAAEGVERQLRLDTYERQVLDKIVLLTGASPRWRVGVGAYVDLQNVSGYDLCGAMGSQDATLSHFGVGGIARFEDLRLGWGAEAFLMQLTDTFAPTLPPDASDEELMAAEVELGYEHRAIGARGWYRDWAGLSVAWLRQTQETRGALKTSARADSLHLTVDVPAANLTTSLVVGGPQRTIDRLQLVALSLPLPEATLLKWEVDLGARALRAEGQFITDVKVRKIARLFELGVGVEWNQPRVRYITGRLELGGAGEFGGERAFEQLKKERALGLMSEAEYLRRREAEEARMASLKGFEELRMIHLDAALYMEASVYDSRFVQEQVGRRTIQGVKGGLRLGGIYKPITSWIDFSYGYNHAEALELFASTRDQTQTRIQFILRTGW